MNRRLEIDISSEHEQQKQYQEEEQEGEEEQDLDEQQEQEVEREEANDEEEFQNDQQSPEHYGKSASFPIRQGFDSAETFANQPTSTDRRFIESLIRHQSPRYLDQTPIGQRPTSHRPADNSTLEDEIARIIKKVNQRQTNLYRGRTEEQTEINKEQLLREHAKLICQIKQLQSKLKTSGSTKHHKKSKESQMEQLSNRLQKYKKKLDKAQVLNSKLFARLTTEKSRSRAISNTFRSLLPTSQPSSQLTNSYITQSNLNTLSLTPNPKYCKRCCKELGQASDKEVSAYSKEEISSKQLIFSPVLQVKNYEITGESKEFELSRKPTRDMHSQTNQPQKKELEEMRKLQEEEKALQSVIEANNRKILEYEELLYQLVELD